MRGVAPALRHMRIPQAERHVPGITMEINPQLVLVILVASSIVLGLLDIITLALVSQVESEQFRRLFNVDEESSIPTWFSVIQLFLAHAILVLLTYFKYRARDRLALYWGLLALVMLALSIDEAASVHESTGGIALGHLGIGGNWIILGGLFTVVVGLSFVPFLLALPRRVAGLFCLAGVVFLSGALGVEVLHFESAGREPSFTNGLIPATEEFLERLGISIFIFTVLLYMKHYMGVGAVALVDPPAPRHHLNSQSSS